ncbi:hypothetical protein CANTEDRAFT_93515 [Yamadazyma tenuis ATCC 10573]|uniref:Uncharacterized protein n=1 Tax=Candida tenuis (strain ATCC 10573 / BCRC 21748 / CBS 615 / JCM 9827 / NBRC 10315 / NRRL Y-1498 / VKM Y-70) TaxID=590646 RepID=G3B4X2_CANTC|nr:uncharacterized protein CANTEDRAFT_93515 [Yamadazyma tenuis ATCC 10573]EGV64011.1 hypothetical protein CANTEDRAFT_93515 [Yamadazyma tenuis ATCC 10573]
MERDLRVWQVHRTVSAVFEIRSKRLLNSYDRLPADIKIGRIRWEHTLDGVSTKVAVSVENYSIVAIYDIFTYSDPIIIQQEASEGIQDFYWIPPVAEQQQEEEGSYTNSKQLIVYTKNHLQVKLYSLDCVQIVWKLTKPVSKTPIFNPQTPNMWSLVLESRSAEVNDQNPIVYHFYNEGSVSKLLYRFKLPNPLLSDDFDLHWSYSGKWLIYLNSADSLFGFNLQVFNSLGVNKRKFNLSEFIPTGDPIINLNWLNDGLGGDDSPVKFGATEYFVTNISIDSITDYIMVLTSDSEEIEIITISVKDFRVVSREKVRNFVGAQIWRESYDGANIHYVQSKLDVRKEMKIKRVFSFKKKDVKYLVVQFPDSILVNEIIINDETLNSSIVFKPIHYIVTDKIITVKLLMDELVVSTPSHVFAFDFKALRILHEGPTGGQIAYLDEPVVVVYDDDGEPTTAESVYKTDFTTETV